MTAVGTRLRGFVDRHVGATALVLIYHRVALLDSDPQLLAVTPRNFDAQMRVLADRCHPTSLTNLVAGLKAGEIVDRSVVVTFDDGYADNLTHAAPVLARIGVPATVFVSSGYTGSGREFWWDEIERLVLLGPAIPPDVTLVATADIAFSWESGGAEISASDPSWTVLEPDVSPRHDLYRRLHEFLRPLDHDSRSRALAQLRGLLGDDGAPRPSHRPLTAEEVASLDAVPGIEVAGHTTDHEVLSALSLDEQRRQIAEDRSALATMCRREISLFSYPYGDLTDYTDDTVAIVREAGYEGACSNHPGFVKARTDAYRIPRVLVRDWDADDFARRLEGWFDGRL